MIDFEICKSCEHYGNRFRYFGSKRSFDGHECELNKNSDSRFPAECLLNKKEEEKIEQQ